MYYQQRGKKYKNINQEYNGIRYDSKLEANRAQELDLLVKAGEIKKWERQKTLDLYFKDYKICGYRIDFVVYENDPNEITLEEVKGVELPVWRLKWKLLEAIVSEDCPERKIILENTNFKPKNKQALKINLRVIK